MGRALEDIANNKLEKHFQKWLKKNPDVKEDEILWATNIEDDEDYAWKFIVGGVTYIWTYNYERKDIIQTSI